MTELALGWVAAHPVVSSVICGATGPQQVQENAKVAEAIAKITPDVMAAIDQTSR
ncbi:MAG: hypothetical protein DWG80_06200 [Chloroflexi bacterium]|nr:hypothetical protein [Chloroflexota bacterium]